MKSNISKTQGEMLENTGVGRRRRLLEGSRCYRGQDVRRSSLNKVDESQASVF